MYVFGYLLTAIARVIDLLLSFFMFIVVARAVLSWVRPDPSNPIVRFIHNVTEPVLYRVRVFLPVVLGGIDFSPILVLIAIVILQTVVVNSLARLAQTLL